MWEGVTVVRTCDSPKEVCQLVGRCDGHGEKCKGMRCMERCDGHDHGEGVRECGKVRQLSGGRCDSSQGGVKVVRNWFQLIEMYSFFLFFISKQSLQGFPWSSSDIHNRAVVVMIIILNE